MGQCYEADVKLLRIIAAKVDVTVATAGYGRVLAYSLKSRRQPVLIA